MIYTLVNYFFCIALLSPVLVYLYAKWKYSYWSRRGILNPDPTFSYGNMKQEGPPVPQFLRLMSNYRIYKAKREKHFGIYQSQSPVYVPIDLDIIKNMLTVDFDHFRNHGFYSNVEDEPLTANLFNLNDDEWKIMRAKLTPTFTSGKMKMMFQTIVDCTSGLEELISSQAASEEPINVKDIMSRFTTDVIGNVAFGIECNTMKNPDSEFAYYAKQIMQLGRKQGMLRNILRMLLPPRLLGKLGFKMMGKELGDFFSDLVAKTIEYREKNNIHRKDFMHLMIQLKNQGRLSDDEKLIIKSSSENGLSMKQVTAQCFVFFTAGFDTSSTTMMFSLLELARNSDIQDKLRSEINRVLKKFDDKITYEAVNEMEYLDKIVAEALRLPETDIVIEKGTAVMVPLYAIHHDPEYFPDPEEFHPERFNEDVKSTRNPYAYMPFGEGPRTCIGLRFGKLQSKVGLISVIKNFKVTLNAKTAIPIKYNPSFLIYVAGGVWLDVEKLN